MLDNPIWHALTTVHAGLAEGDGLARRYPAVIGPLTGLRDQGRDAYDSLGRVLPPAQVAVLFLDAPPVPPPDWALVHRGSLAQMVCARPTRAAHTHAIERLDGSALPEMIALATLTEPGPFGPRTPELGTFLGVHEAGRLVAMAGERLHLPGYTEVSAVCTHPDHRGRGYAAALVSAVAEQMMARGETPMLHVRSDNVGAIRLYERLGFTTRRYLELAVVMTGAPQSPR
jgi:GNAT superfamily N-acetyltransferase